MFKRWVIIRYSLAVLMRNHNWDAFAVNGPAVFATDKKSFRLTWLCLQINLGVFKPQKYTKALTLCHDLCLLCLFVV